MSHDVLSESRFETDLRFLHVITACVIKGTNILCITEITKGQTVISEACHFNLLSAVILVDFSNDSRAFCVIRRWHNWAGEREKGDVVQLQSGVQMLPGTLDSQLHFQGVQQKIQLAQIHHQVVSEEDEVQMLAERWRAQQTNYSAAVGSCLLCYG